MAEAIHSEPSPVQPPIAPSTRKRGVFGFLFKSAIGLTALAIGAFAMLVLLLPALVSPFAPGLAEDWFVGQYRGSLSVAKTDLAWSKEQSIEGVEVFDPAGKRVAALSVRAPGLLELLRGGGRRIGKVSVVCSAALEASDSGAPDGVQRTNLDRALEPREPSPKTGGGTESLREKLEALDLEVDLACDELSWSDARTRLLAKPFVLRDVRGTVLLVPREPLVLHLDGRLEGNVPGKLAIDARVEHPFASPASATPPRLSLDAEVEGFATGLVDGLAGLGGRLTEALGPTFSLRAKGQGTTSEGDLRLELESERAQVTFAGRLEGGLLRSSEQPGFDVSLEAQPAWISAWLGGLLPPGTELEYLPAGKRLTARASEFEIPLAAWLDAHATGDSHAMSSLFVGAKGRAALDLGSWRYEDLALKEAGGGVEIRDVSVQADVSAGDPAVVSVSADLAARGAKPSRCEARAEIHDLAALAAFRPEAELAPVRAALKFLEVPMELVGAYSPGKEALAEALGPRLSLEVAATVGLTGGFEPTVPDAPADWRAFARRLTSDVTIQVTGAPQGLPSALAGGVPLGLKHLTVNASVAPGKPIALTAQGEIVSQRSGKLSLAANVGQAFQEPALGLPLEVGLELDVAEFPTAVPDALAGLNGRLTQLLGEHLECKLSGHGTRAASDLKLDLYSERTQCKLLARYEDGVLRSGDGPALLLGLQPEQAWFDALIAPHLPAGVVLTFEESRAICPIEVSFLSLPVRELMAKSGEREALLDALLSRTRIEASVGLRSVRYQDAKLRAQDLELGGVDLHLGVDLAPGEQATAVSLDLAIATPAFAGGALELHAQAADAKQLLHAAQGGDFSEVAVNLSSKGFPARYLDAWAGGGSRAQDALGASTDLLVKARAEQNPSEALGARFELELGQPGSKSSRTVVGADLKVREPFAERAPGEIPQFELVLDVTGTGALLATLPAELAGQIRELVGQELHASLTHAPMTNAGSSGASRLSLELRSAALELSAAGDVQDRVLTSRGEQGVTLKLTPPPALLQKLVAESLPAGARLELAPDSGPLALEIRDLRAPLAGFFAQEAPGDSEPGPDSKPDARARIAELLAALDARANLALPKLAYTHPPPSSAGGGGVAGTNETPGTAIVLRDLTLAANLKREQPMTARVGGVVDATPPGVIELDVVVHDPSTIVDPASLASGAGLAINGKLSRIPTVIVDALSKQKGLLVDVLGPELDVALQWPDSRTEPLRASLTSRLGTVNLVGRLQDGTLRADSPADSTATSPAGSKQGLDASVGLTPLFSKRIVGNLVPLLFNLSKSPEAGPALITARAFSLPLSGDLSRLSGDVKLDLGVVSYELLPGLSGLIQAFGGGGPKTTQLQPLTIRIDQGIARYDSLPLKLGGRDLVFKGSYDLARSEFKLATDVPLEALGSGIAKELDKVRDLLDPKLSVPIEISGTWSKPRLKLGDDFVKNVIEKAAEGALRKGLEDLLKGGKKKKD